MKLCTLDEEEISHIIYEVLNSKDLEEGKNELAITTSPLYRFSQSTTLKSYSSYCAYCETNGFRKMNIINFEVKSKFIDAFIERKTVNTIVEETNPPDIPF